METFDSNRKNDANTMISLEYTYKGNTVILVTVKANQIIHFKQFKVLVLVVKY